MKPELEQNAEYKTLRMAASEGDRRAAVEAHYIAYDAKDVDEAIWTWVAMNGPIVYNGDVRYTAPDTEMAYANFVYDGTIFSSMSDYLEGLREIHRKAMVVKYSAPSPGGDVMLEYFDIPIDGKISRERYEETFQAPMLSQVLQPIGAGVKPAESLKPDAEEKPKEDSSAEVAASEKGEKKNNTTTLVVAGLALALLARYLIKKNRENK